MKIYFFIFLIGFNVFSEEANPSHNFKSDKVSWKTFQKDLRETFKLIGKASYLQFTEIESAYTLGVGAVALSHGFDYDEHYRRVIARQDPGGWIDSFNTVGTLTTFPFVPGYLYYLSYKRQDPKLYQFTKELTALTYLTLAESFISSLIHVHDRPRTDNLNKWETNFRGDSSFVSGHILPLTSLAYKTWQFYGPLYAAAPTILTLIQSYQRLHDEKHWMSDIIGSYLFVVMGDIGVRKASRKKSNNSSTTLFQILPKSDGIFSQLTYLF